MQKKLWQIFAVLALMLFVAAPLYARPWGIVGTQWDYYEDNESDNESLHTIDLGQTPPVVYGPFLSGQLSSRRGTRVYDIELFQGNKKALVVMFDDGGQGRVNLVDLRDPTNPVLLGSLNLSHYAEDIAITRDGKTAIITDGDDLPLASIINLKTFTVTGVVDLGAAGAESINAVAISKKNVVIFADVATGSIHYGKLNKMRNGFNSIRTIALCDSGQYDNATDCMGPGGEPINITISPNGRTVLVANGNGPTIYVFEITKSGDLVPGAPFILSGLPGTQQSISFQNDTTAFAFVQREPLESPSVIGPEGISYPEADGERPNQLCEISILGPGRTAYVAARFTLLNSTTGYAYGVDTVDIFKRHILVGNPTRYITGPYDNPYYNNVAYIDLVTGVLTPIELNNYGVPVGVAIKP